LIFALFNRNGNELCCGATRQGYVEPTKTKKRRVFMHVFFNHELIPICTTRSRKLIPSDINKQADTINSVIIWNQEFLYPKQNLGFKFKLISDDDFNPILDCQLKVLDSNSKTLFLWRPVYLWRCFLFVEISVFSYKRNTSIEKYKHTVVYEIN
jgi:hypothetical protein